MEWIRRVLYGVLIGVASIAPGLSGGTIAIALGFYEKLIDAVANLLKHFKINFLYLLPYGLGGMFSLAALSVVINYFFLHYPLPTNTLFIGFIVGTLPFIGGKVKSSVGKNGLRPSHWVTAAVFFVIVLIPVFIKGSDGGNAVLAAEPLSVVLLVVIGAVAATTLVIPGLSGTMILTSLGYYKPLLLVASTFVTSAVSLDIRAAAQQLIFIVPLGIGVIVGVFLTAKLVSFLFQRIPAYVYSAITGLIIATPIVMLADMTNHQRSVPDILISLLTLIVGFLLVRRLGDR